MRLQKFVFMTCGLKNNFDLDSSLKDAHFFLAQRGLLLLCANFITIQGLIKNKLVSVPADWGKSSVRQGAKTVKSFLVQDCQNLKGQ